MEAEYFFTDVYAFFKMDLEMEECSDVHCVDSFFVFRIIHVKTVDNLGREDTSSYSPLNQVLTLCKVKKSVVE